MRLVRTVSVAAGACALTAAAAASAVTASPAATTGPVAPGPGAPVTGSPAAGARPLSVTSGGPGVAHAGHRSSAPPTTADCENAYSVACYQPAQISGPTT